MLFKKIYLFLQLAGIGPKIITVQDRHIWRGTGSERLNPRAARVCDTDVLRFQNGMNSRVSLSVTPDDFMSPVRRTISSNDQSVFEVCLLCQYAFNRLSDERLVVARNQVYINQRSH